MSRRKTMKSDRRYLKRAGLGRQHKELGALACALEEVKAVEVHAFNYCRDAGRACRAAHKAARFSLLCACVALLEFLGMVLIVIFFV